MDKKDPCSRCGFIHNCICDHQPTLNSQVEFALLYHENEMNKLTNTGRLLLNSLPNAKSYLWKRKEHPETLIKKINQEDTETWLLFPNEVSTLSGDYPIRHSSNKKQLFIFLDATWQEAKKMVNKTPWLKHLPCLEIQATTTSCYHLRRNQSEGNLCTCEAGIEILDMVKEPEHAQAIAHYYERFLTVFQAERSGHQFLDAHKKSEE
ncbi:tRNA-uridine aminocarboxypropyltransferase [Aliivibrio sifiae]|uniref:tRNA-uridine aminocarboxypropyltransferase n=1 Tax=Aliivibrio sifiae TaxID=566293 RepID=A0A2S7X095_9GAMM|nr:DTW domain-containing protein [Aliivibrio sifiae]PQJ83257.1 DTW domain-containing protein [Aliivibrio sifiae]